MNPSIIVIPSSLAAVYAATNVGWVDQLSKLGFGALVALVVIIVGTPTVKLLDNVISKALEIKASMSGDTRQLVKGDLQYIRESLGELNRHAESIAESIKRLDRCPILNMKEQQNVDQNCGGCSQHAQVD